jgi:hypothetical protein
MVFAGDPEEIAGRIIDLHHHLGHMRHFLQMDIGGVPHAQVLKSIELLGTEVAPRVRAELNSKTEHTRVAPGKPWRAAYCLVKTAWIVIALFIPIMPSWLNVRP